MNFIIENILNIEVLYLLASICFIFSLNGLSSPRTAFKGNIIGAIGMFIAIYATVIATPHNAKILSLSAIIIGAIIGGAIAFKIKMTQMPQLVAGFHSLVGLAAVFVSFVAYLNPESLMIGEYGKIAPGRLIEMSIGCSIGAITFSGSIVAFAKLQGLMSGVPIRFPAQKTINILSAALVIFLIIYFVQNQNFFLLLLIGLFSFVVGYLLIIPVGGADMPVVVSMLNSYSGWAAAGIGFTINNKLLIITGALVGASGGILSYVMCHAMNRSLFNVIFGAFLKQSNVFSKTENNDPNRQVKQSSAEDAAYLLKQASSIIIVPGYGMAVAQAQHIIKELYRNLKQDDINVKFAIHPVAGRMPGHMNVLLAEASIDYEDVYELEDINRDFSNTDVVLVVGANDITNPAAQDDSSSPIYGMQILEVAKAKTVLFIKRGMASGYAGIDNELFYKNNTLMLFGDAKKVIEDVVKNLDI